MKELKAMLEERYKELLKKKGPQKAAQIMKKEYFATGPDKKNLKKSVRDFQKKYGYSLKSISSKEETLQNRMKHAEACFDAMLDVVKKSAMQQMLLEKIAKEQLKKANVVLPRGKAVETYRCLHEMMHLENTPEAKLHNEQVVSLMLYNQKLISEDKFKALRTEQMKNANIIGISDFVKMEAESPKETLLDLIKTEIASFKREAEGAEKSAADILNIKENNPEKLKKAFRTIYASQAELLKTGANLYLSSPYYWQNAAAQEEVQWAREEMFNYGCRNNMKYQSLNNIVNPYFAIMEPEEMSDCYQRGKIRLNQDDSYSALNRYVFDAGKFLSERSEFNKVENDKAFNKKLEKAGMQGAQESLCAHGFIVYKKDNDVVITKNGVSSLAPLKIDWKLAKPTELLKTNFRAEIRDLCEQSAERNKKKSSPAYDNMVTKLKDIQSMSKALTDDLSEGDLSQCRVRLEKLKEEAEKYLAHKEDDFRKRNKPVPEDGYKNHYSELARSSYERKRIELAESVLKFAEGKLAAIDLVGKYMTTMANKAVQFEDPNPAMNRPEMINAGGDIAGNAAKEKEDKKEEKKQAKVLTNINEIINEKDKEEGKEHKEKTQKNSGSNQIVKENPKLQMDPLAKKGF